MTPQERAPRETDFINGKKFLTINEATKLSMQEYLEGAKGKQPGKHILQLPGITINLGTERKTGGLYVVDVDSPPIEKLGYGVTRRLPKPPITSEDHREADLWILMEEEPMQFILGGDLVNIGFKKKSGTELTNFGERIGDSIRFGRGYLLTPEHPRLLIPRGIAHQHGTEDNADRPDGEPIVPAVASAIVLKLDAHQTELARKIRGIKTVQGRSGIVR